jgi:hypothetical protein
MNGEQETVLDATKRNREPQTRQRSKIAFPYMDLKSAVEMASAIYSHVGVGECDDDQLGPWTDQSSKSSTLRVQIYAARTFGILEGEGGKHKLSELGRAIVDPNQARDAKARAFLNVPLYKAIFEKYRGGVLPPAAALQRDIVELGVAEKQKDRARLVFERSADQAGFLEQGRDRLVMPGVHTGSESGKPKDRPGGGGNDGGGGGGTNTPDVDPIITGLLARLPKVGAVWPESERDLWLQLLKGSFQLIYKDKPKDNSPDH